jgi:hypothetical protein
MGGSGSSDWTARSKKVEHVYHHSDYHVEPLELLP